LPNHRLLLKIKIKIKIKIKKAKTRKNMFLISGTIYDKEETLKYNKVYLEELKKHKDHKKVLEISKLKRDAADMTLEEMLSCNHKNLADLVRLNTISLNALQSILSKKLVPVEFAIEVVSKMELGVNNGQFKKLLVETINDDFNEKEDVIIEVINKFKLILNSY
jgi:hypothetical protein